MARGAVLLAGGPLTALLLATSGGLLSPEGEPELEGVAVTDVARGPEATWSLVDGRSVRRSADGRWAETATISEVVGRCLLPLDDGVLVGTSEARLVRMADGKAEPLDAFDDAPGRSSWYTPWGGPPDTRSLAVDAEGSIYANVHVGGILRSRDRRAWEPTIDVDADVHEVATHPKTAGLVMAACAYGLATSTDGGDSWEIEDEGLHGAYCRAVAFAGNSVLVTASTGPFTSHAAVYRRPLRGGRFERCREGLPERFRSNIDTRCLAASGSVVAFGTSEGEVYRSEDEGTTWERVGAGLPAIHAVLALPA